MYGHFPVANGINNATTFAQVDKTGALYATLPQPINTNLNPPAPDTHFPANLPVSAFDISLYVPATQTTGDMVHRFYQNQYQIDGGKMDKFVAWSDAAGLVMGYYEATNMPEGLLAQQYTLCDNFFQSAFGGSFLNHIYLIAAAPPVFPAAPASITVQLDTNGIMTADGAVTPDGFVVNTAYTVNQPHPAKVPVQNLVPNQILPTIGDRLSSANLTWAWYSEGWNNALAGTPDPLFQFHHQPFAYFANYADGTASKTAHLKDKLDFTNALSVSVGASACALPNVSFVKLLGANNEHPGYATLLQGQQQIAQLVQSIQNSSCWADTAIIITYDENGGQWDHVAPLTRDRFGPGPRIPTIIISPFAKKGFVDHTRYETTSILKFIESRWDLTPLSPVDASASNLTNAFQ